ncbi:hypothetical protein FRC01_004303, partial [Tulasnella sp. 417]
MNHHSSALIQLLNRSSRAPQHRLLRPLFSPNHPLRYSSEPLSKLPAAECRRHLATHRESPASSLLSQFPNSYGGASPSSSTNTRSGFAGGADTLGPFPLGIRNPNDAKGKQKAWRELSTSGKVARGTARTTNLTVILIGGAFTCVLAYALATELFAKNSPTRLYDDACQKLNASPEVARYLSPPLKFHINAPSPNAPRHRNRHVSSQLAVDSSGREHLLLHFYVEAAAPQSSSSEADSLPALSELTLDSVYEWSAETWNDVVDSSKRAFAYLVGIRLADPQHPEQPRSPSSSPGRQTEIGKPAKDVSTAWSFAGLFSGLRGMSTSSTDSSETHATHAEWTEGEVHADLVKDDEGNFKYRYLLVDIPHSRMRKPLRIYVEKGAGFREGEGVFIIVVLCQATLRDDANPDPEFANLNTLSPPNFSSPRLVQPMAYVFSRIARRAHHTAANLTKAQIQPGTKLPNVALKDLQGNPTVRLAETTGKNIIVGVPGAFTPVCNDQVPGYIANFDKFKAKGIDDIYVVSVNDVFVIK